MSKTIYHYHPVTGEYVGASHAIQDPVEPTRFLMPADTTDQMPPATNDNQVAIFDRDAERWTNTSDWRGHEYWTEDGERHHITDLGVAPPEGALDAPPPPPPEDLAAKARQRRNGLLRSTDWTQLADAQLRLGPERVAAYEAYRQALADVPQQAAFPEAIEWPEEPESS